MALMNRIKSFLRSPEGRRAIDSGMQMVRERRSGGHTSTRRYAQPHRAGGLLDLLRGR
jgi:hypothetical protein